MIIYCLGMEASGSTWIYNVVREIFAVHEISHVAFRVEEFEQIADDRAHEAKNIIMRAHNVNSFLLRFLEASDTKTIISLRDPRDCVASCIQRFGEYGGKLIPTCNDITRNLASALSARNALRNLTFFYEDGFTTRTESVLQCAEFLGLPISEAQATAIFDRYTPESIKRLIAQLAENRDERLFVDAVTHNIMDRETSFHRTHISDMRVGKWRDVLPDDSRATVERLFDGYARLLSDRNLDLTGSGSELEIAFEGELFSPVDNMLYFERKLRTDEVTSVLGVKVLSDVYLPRGHWRFRFSTSDVAGPTVLKVCQNGEKLCHIEAEADVYEFELTNRLHDHPYDFNLAYRGMDEDAFSQRLPRDVTVVATTQNS